MIPYFLFKINFSGNVDRILNVHSHKICLKLQFIVKMKCNLSL